VATCYTAMPLRKAQHCETSMILLIIKITKKMIKKMM